MLVFVLVYFSVLLYKCCVVLFVVVAVGIISLFVVFVLLYANSWFVCFVFLCMCVIHICVEFSCFFVSCIYYVLFMFC